MIIDLVRKSRSYRSFHEDRPVGREALIGLVDAARLGPASVNLQPLKYYVTADPEMCQKIFPHTKWARLLKDYPGPGEGERPTGYIIILYDLKIGPNTARFDKDVGIAAQTILLAAVEQGMGGIMIGNLDREELMEVLALDPKRYQIALLLAIGYPAEEIILEDPGENGSVAYYRDAEGHHHVPKRRLEEIIVE